MGQNDSAPDSQDNPWALASTRLERARAVKERLEAYGVTDPHHVVTILAELDRHGLFHEVISPKPGDTSKNIRRRAKRMAKALQRRITSILNGKEQAADSQEVDLAERWEMLGEDQMRLEEQKVLSETFQINRGGRIIPRFASPKSRTESHQGPRSEPEITHALQILNRYLGRECSMPFNRRMECLGDILRKAMSLQDSRDLVIERVRWRLRDAEIKTPLDEVDYHHCSEAIGCTCKTNEERQKMFVDCILILNLPDTSTEEKQKAEDTLEKLFSFRETET